MKKFRLAIICVVASFLVAPVARATDMLNGLDMLRKILILNREAGRGMRPDSQGSGGNLARKTEHFETHLSTEGAQSAEFVLKINYGDLRIEPAGGDTLIYVSADYNGDEFSEPTVSHRRDDGRVEILLESGKTKGKNPDGMDSSAVSADNIWHIRIGRQVAWSLQLELAFCATSLELGGMKVAGLNIESGFSGTELCFSEPNGTVLENCDIQGGFTSLRAMKLGNAAIRHLTVENGLGSSLLDFTGKWVKGDLNAVIESGLGAVKMHLPDGLPVTMEVESALGSTDLPGFREIRDGCYRSMTYREGVPSLDAQVSVGLGSMAVMWVERDDSRPRQQAN
jgi:hypothetical protein